jgi:hypothetical protein
VSQSEVFLGVIAAATVLMALIQVVAIVAMLRLVRTTQRAVAEVQSDVRPLIQQATVVATKATAIADEASRTASIATIQAEKIDRLLTDLAIRVDQTAAVVQQGIITPAREGLAIVAALKAVVGALRAPHERPRHGRAADEEDPLFIG